MGFTEHSSTLDDNCLLYDDKFEYCITSIAGKVGSDRVGRGVVRVDKGVFLWSSKIIVLYGTLKLLATPLMLIEKKDYRDASAAAGGTWPQVTD